MNRFLTSALFFVVTSITTLAQTEEPMQLKTDAFTIDGTLTLPDNLTKPMPVLLLIAGSGPTDRDGNSGASLKTNAYKMLADSLVAQGIAVARYDKRGVGQSKLTNLANVKPADGLFEAFVQDAVGLVRQLRADKRFSRVVIAGHSEGSLVGMLAARQTNADGFVSIAGPGRNIADVMKTQFAYALPDSLRAGASQMLDSLRVGRMVLKANPLLLTVFTPKMQPYVIAWMKHDPTVDLKAYRGPVLIVQGTNDFQVPVGEAELLKAARPDAKLLLIPNMVHMLRTYEGNDQAGHIRTYMATNQPLTPGLATAIAQFVKSVPN